MHYTICIVQQQYALFYHLFCVVIAELFVSVNDFNLFFTQRIDWNGIHINIL